MKKIVALILAVVMTFGLVACGNMSLGFGNFTFKKIHVDTYNYNGCLSVIKWYENSAGIEVNTREAGPLFFSEGQYMLISNECPFCAAATEQKDAAADMVERLENAINAISGD